MKKYVHSCDSMSIRTLTLTLTLCPYRSEVRPKPNPNVSTVSKTSKYRCNAFSNQVWGMLEHLPYEDRFQLYGAWRGHAMERQGLGLKHPQYVVAEVSVAYCAAHNAHHACQRPGGREESKGNVQCMPVHVV